MHYDKTKVPAGHTPYRIAIEAISDTSNRFVESFCADITFVNKGESVVKVGSGGYPLEPGESLEIGGEVNQIDVTEYAIHFVNTGGQEDLLLVIRKYYLP